MSTKTKTGTAHRYWLLGVLMLAPLEIGAKGCDRAVVGDERCGGLAGDACADDQYCDYPKAAHCGAADATGTCKPKPTACDGNYAPVCGCDDETYGNECQAHSAGVSVASRGECGSEDDTCGGLAGRSCPDGEYCSYPLDALCGAADATGTCEPIPEGCTLEYAPVCGCNDQTYGNRCAAARDGVSVASEGECPDGEGSACGGLRGLSCEDDEYCDYPPSAGCGFADATGICRPRPNGCGEIYQPVCGCDGTTYGNECEANGAGVSVLSRGECDAPPTAETCGGLTGGSCARGEYCNYPPSALCGAADATGVCTPMPQACDLNYDPVCGCDDQTYGNACAAAMAGVSVASRGECSSGSSGACGGLLGGQCARDEYCHYAEGDLCGAADATGECRTPPTGCRDVLSPVCGCDGVTYGNECEANAAGVSMASKGECDEGPPIGEVCGGIAGFSCPEGQYCNYPPDAACGAGDQTGMCAAMPTACTREYAPVCGCDGKTYGNACTAAAEGVSVQSTGECP